MERYEDEIGVKALSFGEFVYLPEEDRYEDVNKVPVHAVTAQLSGTRVREWFRDGASELPAWFARPEVTEAIAELPAASQARLLCLVYWP